MTLLCEGRSIVAARRNQSRDQHPPVACASPAACASPSGGSSPSAHTGGDEGEALLQMLQDLFAHTPEVFIHIRICKAQHRQSETLKEGVSSLVVILPSVFKMLGTIEFDHQFMRSDIKVNNICSKHLLPSHGLGQGLQKIKPQMSFLPGHFMAHIPRVLKQVLADLLCAHFLPHLSAALTSSPAGGGTDGTPSFPSGPCFLRRLVLPPADCASPSGLCFPQRGKLPRSG